MNRAKLVTKLKYNKAIRVISYPYMSIKRSYGLKRYMLSEDAQRFADLKDLYKGKRCFIIGNGPSLTVEDLDLIKGEYTFGVNGIFQIFDKTVWRPSFYFCADKESWINCYEYFTNHTISKECLLFLDKELLPLPQNQNTVLISTQSQFSLDRYSYKQLPHASFAEFPAPGVFYSVPSVTQIAIQAAIYMGFSTIYFIGQDCSFHTGEHHYPKGFKQNFYFPGLDIVHEHILQVFRIAKEYADTHAVQIYNATRGGELEIFERIDLESLF